MTEHTIINVYIEHLSHELVFQYEICFEHTWEHNISRMGIK